MARMRRLRSRLCHATARNSPKQVAELMFGRDIGDQVGVSEAAWTRFVAREMTPRFPDGLTITDAIGQWRDRDNGRSCASRASTSRSCCPATTTTKRASTPS